MTDVRSGKRLNRLSRDPRRAEGEASLDLGLAQLTTLVNRDIYPVDRYPAGQFEFAASISRATSAVVTVGPMRMPDRWDESARNGSGSRREHVDAEHF